MDEYTFTYAGDTRPVYVVGGDNTRGVLLVHELPGLSSEAIDFATYLAQKNMAVHMPLLYGKSCQSGIMRGSLPGIPQMLCIRREFASLAADHSSPITEWLRALARHVSGRHDNKEIGAVGMCLSGGWVFSLILDFSVKAGVVSQPAVPMRLGSRKIEAGGLGDTEANIMAALGSGKPILGLRFQTDPVCPPARFRALREAYGSINPPPTPAPILRQYECKGHAVLTVDHADATFAWEATAPDDWDTTTTPTSPGGRKAARKFLDSAL